MKFSDTYYTEFRSVDTVKLPDSKIISIVF